MKGKDVVFVTPFSSSPMGLSAKGDQEMKLFETKILMEKYPGIRFDIWSLDNSKCEFSAQTISSALSTKLQENPYRVLKDNLSPQKIIEKIEGNESNVILVSPYHFMIELLKLLNYSKDEEYRGTLQGVIMYPSHTFQKVGELLDFQKYL